MCGLDYMTECVGGRFVRLSGRYIRERYARGVMSGALCQGRYVRGRYIWGILSVSVYYIRNFCKSRLNALTDFGDATIPTRYYAVRHEGGGGPSDRIPVRSTTFYPADRKMFLRSDGTQFSI